jgi:cob(I)alamin adenosyltransferase
VKVYTRKGDDGTTGALYGGRVAKDAPSVVACGDADEAQAAMGIARAAAERGGELDVLLVRLQKELYVTMAELATLPENRAKLTEGTSLVSGAMVTDLEALIDDYTARFEAPTEFVLPGESPTAAALDLARTVVRRAERSALAVHAEGSHAGAYLNRLSDLLWTLARWQEGEARITKTS